MATLSIRIPGDLKKRVAALAEEQGVSMNNFITSCLASAVAQERTRAFLLKRTKSGDPSKTGASFDKIMSKTRPGRGSSMREIDAAIGAR
jgi:predicted DNA-binding protein